MDASSEASRLTEIRYDTETTPTCSSIQYSPRNLCNGGTLTCYMLHLPLCQAIDAFTIHTATVKMTHDLEANLNKFAPFDKEDTAKKLSDHGAKTQDTLADSVEKGMVADIGCAVFRVLTRLRALTIQEVDTTARVQRCSPLPWRGPVGTAPSGC